jgi:hypothetical protein
LYFSALSLTLLKNAKRCRRRHLKVFNVIGDSAKKLQVLSGFSKSFYLKAKQESHSISLLAILSGCN